jgi:hypothetical protein
MATHLYKGFIDFGNGVKPQKDLPAIATPAFFNGAHYIRIQPLTRFQRKVYPLGGFHLSSDGIKAQVIQSIGGMDSASFEVPPVFELPLLNGKLFLALFGFRFFPKCSLPC